MKWCAGLCVALFLVGCVSHHAPEKSESYIDHNKNGKMDPYEDASVPTEKRIDNLLKQMTVEEKTCQLATLYGYHRQLMDAVPTPAWKQAIWKDGLANIDEHLNGWQ